MTGILADKYTLIFFVIWAVITHLDAQNTSITSIDLSQTHDSLWDGIMALILLITVSFTPAALNAYQNGLHCSHSKTLH